MIRTDIAIIGGGASGLTASIAAARQGVKTVIIEHMDRVGKKILATGNGKCNYTNALQGVSYYRGEDPAFVLPVFEQFGLEQTVDFLKEIGIYPKIKNGYYYPASEQAASVLDVLRMEADYAGVLIKTSCEIQSIRRTENQFSITSNQDTILAKAILFAPGLLASPKTGSDGSMLPYIEKFGHHLTDIVPALVQLKGKQSFFKTLAGIRAGVQIEMYVEGEEIRTENGELQLTDYGISGIPVFQLSRFATKALKNQKKVYVLINFIPDMAKEELFRLLQERFFKNAHGKTAQEALIGLFPKKLIDVLLKESGIQPSCDACRLTAKQIRNLSQTIQAFRVDVTGSKGFESAQICAGGVDTSEINAHTLASKLVPGIFFAGEVIDIDGTCGGYNLQWAWSSGYVAGIHAAEYCKLSRR